VCEYSKEHRKASKSKAPNRMPTFQPYCWKFVKVKKTLQQCSDSLRHAQQYHLRVVVRSTLSKQNIRLKQAQRYHSKLAKLDRSCPVFYTPSSWNKCQLQFSGLLKPKGSNCLHHELQPWNSDSAAPSYPTASVLSFFLYHNNAIVVCKVHQ